MTTEAQNDFLSDTAVTESVAALGEPCCRVKYVEGVMGSVGLSCDMFCFVLYLCILMLLF